MLQKTQNIIPYLGCVSFNYFPHFCGHDLCESKWILAGVILHESLRKSILGFRAQILPLINTI